ncbi:hypothetical protein M427DRAFT_95782 [Gonapodya prolifera JEL478]|uniref:DUF202 domain-containing protein n=1 Tax=Gonapodya prolifera (strain JEL478) TaxID=1344416 RepID=A0A139AQH0_GONPJ|nr:hypothetical protein M427DRAFT_95782 [Gonapodya prolifera JEL478]|eukprot:KXS18989.1 hypothetical protein M427DRAFT_95782 [Gonapodya prolifera JEL478]
MSASSISPPNIERAAKAASAATSNKDRLGWFAAAFGLQPVKPGKPGKKSGRIEPKVFFANERTFLSWMRFGVLIGAFSLALLNFSQERIGQIGGTLLTATSIGILIYALYLFRSRNDMLRGKIAGPYEAPYGPVLMVVFLSVAVLVNFGMRWKELSN